MKVLWISDAGCYTGFAKVTHEIGERLVTQHGHEVSVLATNFNGDFWDTPLHLYVANTVAVEDIYGQARFLEMAAKHAEAIVMVHDPQLVFHWLFQNRYDPGHNLLKAFAGKIITYTPIDGYDYPSLYNMIGLAGPRVAMSAHGQQQIPDSRLIYHGVDTDKFWPVSSDRPIIAPDGSRITTKRQCKKVLGFADNEFVIGRVDSNSGRKDYAALWHALLPVMRRHSEVRAYWLTALAGYTQGGIDMRALWSRETELADRFLVPEGYGRKRGVLEGWGETEMNVVYNAFDLFVSTSRGEGFGLTLAEALACGVPVIAQNVSAIPEVVGPGGTLLEPQRRITVPHGQDQWLADIDAFTEAIERAYLSRAWRRGTGNAGREHVSSKFRWDDAAAAFHALLTEVAAHGSDTAAQQPDGDEPHS